MAQKLSKDKSQEQALIIMQINPLIMSLDVDYLTETLKQMEENHSMRESASILDPDPFTHNEKQDLNKAKLEQLNLMLKLAKNVINIKELTIKLANANNSVSKLKDMFS